MISDKQIIEDLRKENVELRQENLKYLQRLVDANSETISVTKKLVEAYNQLLEFVVPTPKPEPAIEKDADDTSRWMYWGGWASNHDQRIDDAKCLKCGYKHETVYGSTKKLAQRCPRCNRIMIRED